MTQLPAGWPEIPAPVVRFRSMKDLFLPMRTARRNDAGSVFNDSGLRISCGLAMLYLE